MLNNKKFLIFHGDVMKKSLIILVILGMQFFVFAGNLLYAGSNNISDEFYKGLAVIIERNMDNPQACLQEVNLYYKDNQSDIQKIREGAQEALEKSAPMMNTMMDKYMNMSEEELAELEKQSQGYKRKSVNDYSLGIQRYSEALKKFTGKHPKEGMKIAMLALELVPSFENR